MLFIPNVQLPEYLIPHDFPAPQHSHDKPLNGTGFMMETNIPQSPIPPPIYLHRPLPKHVIAHTPPPAPTTSNYLEGNVKDLSCPRIDRVTYWREEATTKDLSFTSHFSALGPTEKYVTFEPDEGGWNNIRLQMEIVLVFAAVTGRTLVLPPDQGMYLLNKGKGRQNSHHFSDFFPFDRIKRDRIVKVITMDEFLAREAITGNLKVTDKSWASVYNVGGVKSIDPVNSTNSQPVGTVLFPPDGRRTFDTNVRKQKRALWTYLRNAAACPKWQPFKHFVVFPSNKGRTGEEYVYLNDSKKEIERLNYFAGDRQPVIFDASWQNERVIHFISVPGQNFRLMTNFYTFLYFENEWVDKYYKRVVRDYLRYKDYVFCKASIVVERLMRITDGHGYSAFQIRRGELQYKEVKIPADKLLENVGKFIPKGQVIYIATDERNKTFFDPLKTRFPRIYFLDDFSDDIGMKEINPNYMGMIDQIVCTRGQIFIGTWFSTFSAYITRLRGYLGHPDTSVWYGDMKHRDRFQKPEIPKFPYYMREWKEGYEDIDDETDASLTPLYPFPAKVSTGLVDEVVHPNTCSRVDRVTYWREEATTKDLSFTSHFSALGPTEKYVTFEPDEGGWNNIRLQMEIVLVFAAVTGRTLVLPPDQGMYLLNKGKGRQNSHHFSDFFPFDRIKRDRIVKVITMDEFLAREAVTGNLKVTDKSWASVYNVGGVKSIDPVNSTNSQPVGTVLFPPDGRRTFDTNVRKQKRALWTYLRNAAACPKWQPFKHFVVFPSNKGRTGEEYVYLNDSKKEIERLNYFAGDRQPVIFDASWQNERVIHFISVPGQNFRLMTNFYTFLYFEDEWVDKYYKRVVRDYLRYKDYVFCKASIVVERLMRITDGHGYSAFQIRRGELQYKEVKIPADKLLENVGKFIPKGQVIYIATDERNKTFFDPLKTRFPRIYFLDDFSDDIGMKEINPNYMGMIDQIVCTRGQIFIGTWFSTFSAYITRLRGYLGHPDTSVWYGDMKHRDRFQKPEIPKFPYYMREWKEGYEDIDDETDASLTPLYPFPVHNHAK